MDLRLWSSDRLPTDWQPSGDGLKIAAEVIPKMGKEWTELVAKSTLPLVITTASIATGASATFGIFAAALLTIFFEHIKGQSSTDKYVAAMVKEPLVNGCDKIRLALTAEWIKPEELARRDKSLHEAAEALLKAKAHFKDTSPDFAETIEYLNWLLWHSCQNADRNCGKGWSHSAEKRLIMCGRLTNLKRLLR